MFEIHKLHLNLNHLNTEINLTLNTIKYNAHHIKTLNIHNVVGTYIVQLVKYLLLLFFFFAATKVFAAVWWEILCLNRESNKSHYNSAAREMMKLSSIYVPSYMYMQYITNILYIYYSGVSITKEHEDCTYDNVNSR